ncbi:MAG: NUDIX domain-containing protein [Ignavibacteriales bacterium]
MDFTEKTLGVEQIYKGYIISLEKIAVELPDGRISNRDVVRHPGASMVIPVMDDGKIIMVRQYRKAIEKASLEMPAGKLDAGEEPLACAKRELEEETGYIAQTFKHLATTDSAPGFTDEHIYIYLARGLKPGKMNLDSDEFIENETYSIDELINMVLCGKITDAKTINGVFLANNFLR